MNAKLMLNVSSTKSNSSYWSVNQLTKVVKRDFISEYVG